MLLPSLPPFALLAAAMLDVSPAMASAYPADIVDKLASTGMTKLQTYLEKSPVANCTLENAVRRVEWSDMPLADRQAYTQAVLCLATKAPNAPADQVPGARSRYDDFVATHIVATPNVHGTANFLGWHRLYLHAYEKALREECGYTGYQPYWNWDRYAADPASSPLFNGNASSMGGNGAWTNHTGLFGLAPGDGGGCMVSGPFVNFTVNLGPVAAVLTDVKANPQTDGLGYNPRCLRRDINRQIAAFTVAQKTSDLITNSSDIGTFQDSMQAAGFGSSGMGVHSGGHYTVGGDPGGDFFVSPGDPGFWLHHAMIDRVWWIWQLQDLENRLSAIAGGTSMMGDGPAGTLNDVQNISWSSPGRTAKLGDLLNTIGGDGGEFCYVYA